MLPTLKKLEEHTGFGLSVRPSVRPTVRPSVRSFVRSFVLDIALNRHVWIPNGKIADAYFFSELSPFVK